VARKSLSAEGVKGPYELSIVFCNDEFIRQLNRQYRGVDAPTDVLSFPQEGEAPSVANSERILGDVVISVETARRQAEKRGQTFEDEIRLLIVHGVLHLLGYEDETEEQAERMHAREAEILQSLRTG